MVRQRSISAILLTSSLTMVLAIEAAADGRRAPSDDGSLATAALGFAFVGVKGFE